MKATTQLPVVIVADDETQLRRMFAVSLEFAGYTVYEAATSQRMHDLFTAPRHRQQHLVLLLDLFMPGVDSFGMLTWLGHHPEVLDHTRVIVMAGNPERLAEARDYPHHGQLAKPFSLHDLLAIVAGVSTPVWPDEIRRASGEEDIGAAKATDA